jgi:hypothetical protein
MQITHEALIDYWLSEPVLNHEPGCIYFNDLPFPDLQTLTMEERERSEISCALFWSVTRIICSRKSGVPR